MAGPFLVERGIDPSPEGVGTALLMRLLTELPGSVPTYFRHLADQPKMVRTVGVESQRRGLVVLTLEAQ